MNFLQVKQLQIPEGDVKEISAGGVTLWRKPTIYGASWGRNTSNTWTRTDASASFANPTVGTGTTKGSSSFDNCYPWKDIKKVTDGNNTLVQIPKFWFKWTVNSSKIALQIADWPIEGFHVSPMHADRGDGKGERDYAYIGRYRCGNSNYYSKTGVAPQASISITTARSKIKALGTGYYQMDFAAFWTLRMLYLVEFANWDAFSVIPRPNNPTYANVKSGYTDAMTYHTGTSANGYSFQYRYVEDPWVGMLEWCDGIYFKNKGVYVINNPNNFSNTANGTLVANEPTAGSELYIKNFAAPTVAGYEWALFPSELSSTLSNCVPDTYYQTATPGVAMYIGGSTAVSYKHGPFFMYCDFSASGTSSYVGARLMKLP